MMMLIVLSIVVALLAAYAAASFTSKPAKPAPIRVEVEPRRRRR